MTAAVIYAALYLLLTYGVYKFSKPLFKDRSEFAQHFTMILVMLWFVTIPAVLIIKALRND